MIAFQHPADFTERLAEYHIKLWSNPGDLTPDLKRGAGGTGKMAHLNSRVFVGDSVSISQGWR